jgi:DNA-binding transcriptional regulator GbsR (MarR family)
LKKLKNPTAEIRSRLIEVAGKTSQDLGLGRIVGQILVYLYLRNGDCSLDTIGEDLGLSKASVSVAVRQLESLGLLRRTWKKGDRKGYYRTADDVASALQNGLLTFVRQKMQAVGNELQYVTEMFEKEGIAPNTNSDTKFLYNRVKRAKVLYEHMGLALESPLMEVVLKP